jgi:hypothetical protein
MTDITHYLFRQTQYDALKKQMEVMEMEVMEARLIRAAEINGEVDDDDAGGSEVEELDSNLSTNPDAYPWVITPLVHACLLSVGC